MFFTVFFSLSQLDPVSLTSQQYFDGFLSTSQFWRLHVIRTHGSNKTAICNVKLFGVETMLAKWFAECGCTQVRKGDLRRTIAKQPSENPLCLPSPTLWRRQYYHTFVEKGYNQMEEILKMSSGDVGAIISLPGHRKKFELAVKHAKGEVRKHCFSQLVAVISLSLAPFILTSPSLPGWDI